MVVLLNGAFGIGKTSVARGVRARLRGSRIYDPELVGMALQRGARALGWQVGDFQSLALWRRATVAGIRLGRATADPLLVPMAFSDPDVYDEIVAGVERREPNLLRLCLVAPLEVVEGRLRGRGADPASPGGAWQLRRAAECCDAHAGDRFGDPVPAGEGGIETVVEDVLRRVETARLG